jgi:hypothetical protein
VTDEDARHLREQTAGGDRIDEAVKQAERRQLVEAIVAALDEIDAGDRQKTVSVWDGRVSAYLAALDEQPEARAALADVLADEFDRDVAADVDRSDLIRLLLRLGIRSAAPDHLDALREAVREQAVDDL